MGNGASIALLAYQVYINTRRFIYLRVTRDIRHKL